MDGAGDLQALPPVRIRHRLHVPDLLSTGARSLVRRIQLVLAAKDMNSCQEMLYMMHPALHVQKANFSPLKTVLTSVLFTQY